MYKINLEHLVAPGGKEVSKNDGTYQSDKEGDLKGIASAKYETISALK